MSTPDSQFLAFQTAPTYSQFKKKVRALREQGFQVTPVGDQAYEIKGEGAEAPVLVKWTGPEGTVLAAPEKSSKKEPGDKKKKASGRKIATREGTVDQALAWIRKEIPDLIVNPAPGSVPPAFCWDVSTLYSEETGDLPRIMTETFLSTRPSADPSQLAFFLFDKSPTGTTLAQPLVGIGFRTLEEETRVTQVEKELSTFVQ
jgi:hypothetical protein